VYLNCHSQHAMMTAATESGYDVRIRKRDGTRGRSKIVLRAMRPLPLTEK
jgi:hypothetical protein